MHASRDQSVTFQQSTEIIAKTIAKKIIASLRQSDFGFEVEAAGIAWDVYRYNLNGKSGMIAIAIVDGKAVVGGLLHGNPTAQEMIEHIEKKV